MKINFQPGKGNKIHIMVDGEYLMTSNTDFIALSKIEENREITEEELAAFQKAVNSNRAFNKAADLLSRRDHSSKELLQKLRQKGFSEGAEEAIERLSCLGYIDDRKFAERYADELKRVKKYGKRRIRDALYQKGIDSEIIDGIVSEMEIDNDELVRIIERKYRRYLGDEKGIRKTFAALTRMGYSFSEIKEALNAVAKEESVADEEYL